MNWIIENGSLVLLGFGLLTVVCFGIVIIPQTHRGVVETVGKYSRFLQPGINLIIPIIEHVKKRNITERMTNVEPQDIITKDNLNARVDLVVYHKVNEDEQAVKNSYYRVEDYKTQIVMLSQTTARNVIGDMKFADVNSQRNLLNKKLAEIIDKEIENWGISVVRVEMKEITPPKDVQETMNQVIKAQNEKEAAIDFATSKETQADGLRRAAIKEAEGKKQANILEAEGIKQSKIMIAQGEAEAIKLVNEAAYKIFKGNAVELKRLETVEEAMSKNSKFILTSDLVDRVSKVLNGVKQNESVQ